MLSLALAASSWFHSCVFQWRLMQKELCLLAGRNGPAESYQCSGNKAWVSVCSGSDCWYFYQCVARSKRQTLAPWSLWSISVSLLADHLEKRETLPFLGSERYSVHLLLISYLRLSLSLCKAVFTVRSLTSGQR